MHWWPTLLLEDSLSNFIPEAKLSCRNYCPCRMVAPSCVILGRSLTSVENMEKDSATAFSPCHDKTLAPAYFGFSEHHQVTSLGQKAQPSTCARKLQGSQLFTQKLPNNKGKHSAAVSQKVIHARSFSHHLCSCLLSSGTFPKLPSPQHDCLNVPQTVEERVPRKRMVIRKRCSFSLKQSI